MNNVETAETLRAKLATSLPPVALAFIDAPPDNCAVTEATVPSACAFWREAERGLFFAPAARHFNCPVGAMVMGFELPEEVNAELAGLVGSMTECGYIGANEPAHIPVNAKRAAAGILYGPLEAFPVAPDAVLVWLTPAQAMLLNEAAGAADWETVPTLTVTGRPACAAIPTAMAADKTTFSLGCIGMRTFTGIGEDLLLTVLPGEEAMRLCDALAETRAVNERMQAFYESRQAAIS